ncbi:integrase catalytic domain-containing protein [Trichonephila clavipes]|nr:integrase catalytic domain-containing protein [Trichonephila clavipes]
MREDACVRTCQPDYIWSEKLKDLSIADVVLTNPEDRESNVVDSSTQNTVLSSTASQHRKNVLISTGSVFLRNNEGRELKCPVIFDSASNINIISRKMCDFLGIAIEKINSSVSGLNSLKQNLKGKTNTLISNKSGTFRENVEFFVTEKITGLTPSVTLDVSEIKIPEFLELSDPYFYEAKEIHALLNADIFFRIIKDNVYKVNKELLFRETEFGWIAGGRLQGTNTNNFSCYFLKDNDSVDDTLKLFFELESLGIKDDPCYRKDDQAMNIFKETVQYNNNRYVVELPFRKHWNELSNNISVAKQRFQSLWGRLRRDKTLYTQYKETIQDYLNQGIIEKVNDTEINVHKPMYYLPHQAIKKEGRVTTSTRIVFDAASHQANELSLNDCLWPGPNLNPNLLDVLINFRLNRVAISSDIRQAFLQICLADKHKDFVRFLWTDSNPRIGEKLTLQVYRFNRVIFGVNSSPFLLAATIKYHIEKYNEIHPITVQHLDSFMYVDDWITGQDTREEALFMSRHAKNIMKEAGMEMRKWISNDTVLMAQWAAEGFDTHPMDASIRLGTNKTKVLGMAWQTLDDCLTLDTKDNLRIPRLVLDSTNDEVSDLIEIHIFCDASKLAYGAAAYVKVRKQNEVLVNLITSKTRVAPLKAVTLPRLELLGALVAARLSSRVQEIVRKKKECKVFHWTDSKIVLFWIKGSSKRWKQFVANRVQEISELTDPDSWFHCSGQDNPSDFLSRGLSVDTLISNNKWWTGPAFLRTDELPKTVSECPELNEVDYLPELKSKDSKEHTVLTLNFNQTFFDHLLSRSNKFLTIVRVLSFLYRFLFNIRNPTNKKTGPLTSDEMKEAEIYLMKQVQLSSFYKEIRAMQNGDDICNKSKILNLSPFLDDKGIIRVGGRLKHSRLPYSSKHPILLPAKSKLTIIIVKYYHEKYFHLGPQHLLYQVRLKYWPIHGRNICRKVVHNCVICFKFNPKICSQKMGDLPKERITPDKVFNSTGIDLCGPFFIKNKYQRKGPEIKVYVCIFICLVTKAIHLEIISDLTSQALIAALKRFISRRGKCHKIFSDNGTNMIGANREIKALSKLVRDREESLFAFFAEEGIEWSFIPPRSPNWGGLWEANIKSLKYHFKRVAGNSKFSYEELLTLITQIEAILNSRPLTPLSSDVDDLEVLTPAHFLIGRPITAIVEPSLLQCESNRLNVWQRITKSVQTIWKRWSLSYLNSLQQRKKWIVNKENLKLGDMVLIREENLPPCKWLLGRVVKIYMGKDKKVRVVDIKTGKGIYKRSINRLSILPIEN